MGFFDSIQKPGFKAATGKNSHIHQELAKIAAPTRSPIPFEQRFNKRSLLSKLAPKQQSLSARTSPKPKPSQARKRAATATPQPLQSDSDGDSSEQDLGSSRKRLRRNSDTERDPNRCIRSAKAFSGENDGSFPMVHAGDIASFDEPKKYKAAFPEDTDATEIHLQYPSASQQERYCPIHTGNGLES